MAQESPTSADRNAASPRAYATREDARIQADSPAAYTQDWERPYPQYQPAGNVLMPFPVSAPGEIAPQQLSKSGGARAGISSLLSQK